MIKTPREAILDLDASLGDHNGGFGDIGPVCHDLPDINWRSRRALCDSRMRECDKYDRRRTVAKIHKSRDALA